MSHPITTNSPPRTATPISFTNPSSVSTTHHPISEFSPSPSLGSLHPSILQQDNVRKAETGTAFTFIIMQSARSAGHKEVEVALKAALDDPNSKKYAQYLQNAFLDYTLIESTLQEQKLPLSTLAVIYRTDAIQKDLAFLKFKGNISDSILTHTDFYTGLKNKPHVLLGFYSFLVLGLFAAGKARSEKISQTWGEGATHLFQFGEDREKLRDKFKEELNAYMAKLPDEKMDEVKAALVHVWEYIGDLLDINIREKKA